jgi:hypothetical protein
MAILATGLGEQLRKSVLLDLFYGPLIPFDCDVLHLDSSLL